MLSKTKQPIKATLFLLLLLFFAYLSHFPIQNNDFGWHILNGKHFLELQDIPKKDHLSFTSNHKYLTHFNLVSDSILYLIYSSAGVEGLILFRIVMMALIIVILFSLAELLNPKRTLINLFLITLLFYTIRLRLLVRPLLFTMLCFSGTYFFLIRYSLRNNNKNLFLAAIFTLANLWLHGMWFLNCFLWIEFSIFGLFLDAKSSLKRRLLNPYMKFGLITGLIIIVLTIFFTIPQTSFLYPFLLKTKYNIDLKYGTEAYAITFKKNLYFFFCYTILCMGAWFTLIKKSHQGLLTRLSLFQPFLWLPLAFLMMRLYPYTVMALFPLLVLGFKEAINSVQISIKKLSIAIIILFSTLVFYDYFLMGSLFGYGLSKHKFSRMGTAFLKEHLPKGNMYNDLGHASHLLLTLYPDKKVFYDGRLIAHAPGFLNDVFFKVLYADPGWQEVLNKYNVDFVVLKNNHPPIEKSLLSSREWNLVFWDNVMVIFFRVTKDNTEFINSYGYKLFKPNKIHDFFKGDKNQQEMELDLLKKQASDTPIPYYYEARLAWERGQWNKALKNLDTVMEKQGWGLYPATLAGIILTQSGRVKEAELFFILGVKNKSNNKDPYPIKEIIKYYQLTQNKNAARKWKEKLAKITKTSR